VAKIQEFDVVIVGAGAAGLSAGLVMARAAISVALVDAGEPRNAPAEGMHGFISRDGIPPGDFLTIATAEVVRYGATTVTDSVHAIERAANGRFIVTLSSGPTLSARAVLIATGLRDELPEIPGVQDRWGSLVHHCPYCHGWEVRDRAIVVIGGAARELSMRQARLLRRLSDRVTLATNGIELTPAERASLAATGVTVIDGTVSHLVGEPHELAAVALTDGTLVTCDAVFVAPRPRPNDTLLLAMGCAVDPALGFVAVDAVGHTSVVGVWAAGNVVTPTAQVITAAGNASASAIAISAWLLAPSRA